MPKAILFAKHILAAMEIIPPETPPKEYTKRAPKNIIKPIELRPSPTTSGVFILADEPEEKKDSKGGRKARHKTKRKSNKKRKVTRRKRRRNKKGRM